MTLSPSDGRGYCLNLRSVDPSWGAIGLYLKLLFVGATTWVVWRATDAVAEVANRSTSIWMEEAQRTAAHQSARSMFSWLVNVGLDYGGEVPTSNAFNLGQGFKSGSALAQGLAQIVDLL